MSLLLYWWQAIILHLVVNRRNVLEKKLADADVSEEDQNNLLKFLEKKETEYMRLQRHKMGADDFELLTMIGKGAFGEVKIIITYMPISAFITCFSWNSICQVSYWFISRPQFVKLLISSDLSSYRLIFQIRWLSMKRFPKWNLFMFSILGKTHTRCGFFKTPML